MGEFSYTQSDDLSGYGDFSAGYAATEAGYEYPADGAADHGVGGYPSAGGYQEEIQSLIPEGVPLLAAVLLEQGVLDHDQLHAAMARQAESGDSLAQVLLEGNWAAPDQLLSALQLRASYGAAPGSW